MRNDADQVEGITEVQREAIDETMKIILEEDRERGVSLEETFQCRVCGHSRQLAGSIEYDGIRFCQRCATRFEVARVGGKIRTSAEYIGRRKAKKYT